MKKIIFFTCLSFAMVRAGIPPMFIDDFPPTDTKEYQTLEEDEESSPCTPRLRAPNEKHC